MATPGTSTAPKKSKRLKRLDRLVLRLFIIRRDYDGIEIACDNELEFGRVSAALDLIKVADPLRYARVHGDIDRVMVHVLTGMGSAQYNARFDACEIDRRYLLESATTDVGIASTIVHEATHARLERLGFTYAETRRPRLEIVCLRRELAFLNRFSKSELRRDEVERTLANMPDLSDAAFQRSDREGIREGFRYLKMPLWLVPPVMAIRSCVSVVRRLIRPLRR